MSIFLFVSAKTNRSVETPLYFFMSRDSTTILYFLKYLWAAFGADVKMYKIHVLSLKTTMYVRRLKT